MNEDTLQLSQDDIRAQEMVFWLKKLSLEIPQAVKPNLDLSAVTTIIEAQTERLKVLEEYAKRQSAAIESLIILSDSQAEVIEEIKAHLYRLDTSQSASSLEATYTVQDPRRSQSARLMDVHSSSISQVQQDGSAYTCIVCTEAFADRTRDVSECDSTPGDLARMQAVQAQDASISAAARKRRLISIDVDELAQKETFGVFDHALGDKTQSYQPGQITRILCPLNACYSSLDQPMSDQLASVSNSALLPTEAQAESKLLIPKNPTSTTKQNNRRTLVSEMDVDSDRTDHTTTDAVDGDHDL